MTNDPFMKKNNLLRNIFSTVLVLSIALITSSCFEDSDGSPKQKPGNPVFQSVAPVLGASGAGIVIRGTGLGDIRSIVFDMGDVPAVVTTTLNTDNAVVLVVPEAANVGMQNIVLTNSAGKSITAPFQVLGVPNITDVSNYNFSKDEELTLTGKNLDDVSKVIFTGTTTEITVVSKTATSLTLKFPETTLAKSTLTITNVGGTTTTSQVFVSRDNAFKIFTDQFENGFVGDAWGDAAFVSSTVFKAGTSSVAKNYQRYNWHLIGFKNDNGISNNNYAFLTFWIKGGAIEHTFYLMGDQRAGGFGNSDRSTPVVAPAEVWTYFKIPIADARLWENAGANGVFKEFGFWIPGPDNADEVIYFDDVMLVK